MVFKALRSGRPSTSASNKRYSTFDPPDAAGTRSHSSLDKGHKKIGSLHRLSLSFSPSKDGHLAPFLSPSPEPEPEPKPDLTLPPIDTALSNSPSPVISPEPSQLGLIVEPPTTPPEGNDTLPVSETKEDDEPTPRPQRFSLMKFRHASEPQLSTRYKETDADERSPQLMPRPPPPQIITTAPTQQMDVDKETPTTSRDTFMSRSFSTFRKSQVVKDPVKEQRQIPTIMSEMDGVKSTPNLQRHNSYNHPPRILEEDSSTNLPPAYGDESASALAIPVSRLSDSSQGSSGSHQIYAKTTTTHMVSTTTTFFKLKRNKDKSKPKERKKKTKDKGMLFPLPEDLAPSSSRTSESRYSSTPLPGRDSMSLSRTSMSPSRKSTQNIRWGHSVSARDSPVQSPSASATALTNAPLIGHAPAMARNHSTLSNRSGASSPSTTLVPPRPGVRGRSSTLGSLSRSSERLHEHLAPSGRTSTSTAGRISFGDILSLSQRLRQNSAPPRHDSNNSGSTPASKSNSFQIPREPEPELVYPQREEADTPASYLEKLEAAVPRGAMATILCKYGDDFSKTCLRKYMRGFSYFGESIDMAIRKMLMEVILPKETQQIDRLLQGFADRYHECNPGVFMNADEANFVSFSILLLQSDSHNKNNKRKMTKQDYVKNTQNGRISVAEPILECFFDNICYTPFIHFDDDIAVNNHRLATPKARKTLMRSKSSENLKGPVDPYALILDNKLDMLRPPLKDALETEDPYSTVGTSDPVYTAANHKAFVRSAVLQIVSARSRPDAFMTQATISNPAEAQAGLVSIKVAKVGLLWRKSIKKKKGKSPWQEWGAILTDSKLYFFKDVSWVKKLIAQYEGHAVKVRSAPLVFKPPVTSFAPDALMAMDDAVALIDSSYKRHKNAFTFIKHGGFEEVFLANSEGDMEDWIGKLNYAATFRTAGVRMRGLLGTNYEGRQMFRKDSELSTMDDSSQQDKDTSHMAWEIMFYRRQLVSEKISSFDDHVASAQKELDYLLRNARHLVILLPIQQKTREVLVSAAGRMNAKLKWTRKEIWRAKTHRDILIKDLEAEATSAFPAPPAVANATTTTPVKITPTKVQHDSLLRTETDQTIGTQNSTSVGSPTVRRPSQAVLEQIQTDNSDAPELLAGRRKSLASITAASPKAESEVADDKLSIKTGPTAESHSLHAIPSDPVLQQSRKTPSEVDMDEEASLKQADLLPSSTTSTSDQPTQLRRGSETSRERGHGHNLPQPHLSHSESLKDRTSNVRRSLHRTLREGTQHVHIPHHTHSRSKRGKESGSSLGVTSDGDGRSITSGDGSHDSQELRRDPTGRFILHGKKASVITMAPEWTLSSEDRMKLREQAMAKEELAIQEGSEKKGKAPGMRIDTDVGNDFPIAGDGTGPARNSANLSVYSALTSAPRESFHSAHSSRRESNASI